MSQKDDSKKGIFTQFRRVFQTDETFHETQVQANRLGTAVMIASGIILAIILGLNTADIFKMDSSVVFAPLVQGIIETAVVSVICIFLRFDKAWLKWILVIAMALVYARLDGIFTHKAWILMVIPVIFSARYFSRKLTVFASSITSGLFFLSALWGSQNGLFDLNLVSLPSGTQMVTEGGFLDQAVFDTGFNRADIMWDTIIYNYIPKWMLFFLVTLISLNIARRGRDMVLRQHERDKENARIESELELARRIQADMLVDEFPESTIENPYEIYASMTPAKEVGGDFYDFFDIDETHLGLVIADVSGKGIPAAMFMTRAMAIIKGSARPGCLPEDVLAEANNRLCENNDEEMFVTAWFGILDKAAGRLTAANAGHEYPVIKQGGDVFVQLKDKHGFVLGGMENAKYKGYEILTKPGDCIFLYTDGLPEAESPEKEFFGMERIIETLNKEPGESPEKIIANMTGAVRSFTGDEPQFDDLTMLCLKVYGKVCPTQDSKDSIEYDEKDMTNENEGSETISGADTLVIAARNENIDLVTGHISKSLKGSGCPDKVRDQINIAADEIFSNIANYAYSPGEGEAAVNVKLDENKKQICITFTDKGKKFNPFEADDPDVSLSADERGIGGLGIFMVKRIMDEVKYEYKDGQNILKIYKSF